MDGVIDRCGRGRVRRHGWWRWDSSTENLTEKEQTHLLAYVPNRGFNTGAMGMVGDREGHRRGRSRRRRQ